MFGKALAKRMALRSGRLPLYRIERVVDSIRLLVDKRHKEIAITDDLPANRVDESD